MERSVGDKKEVVESGESTTLRSNAKAVDRGVLEYVRKRMGREEISGEVIGNAIIYLEEIDAQIQREMRYLQEED